ncbi:MAG: hypothetical protein MUF34_30620 [Polyangiaceae bacterium]|nr:hypothetical protein [Polyangiaceae bacterium]
MARGGTWVLAAGVLAAIWAGCSGGYVNDSAAYCRDMPTDPACRASIGGGAGTAGGAGTGGAAGASGSSMGASGGGTGGGGASGLGGASGTSGAGGSGGVVCSAPAVACAGACVDVKASDATNCGACGRRCLGAATCVAGACVPEAMATGEVAPYALVADGASLYWVSPTVLAEGSVNDARMRRVAKANAGGTAENVFDSTRVRARSLGFDGTKLYWGDLGANPGDTANQKLVSGAPAGDPVTFEPGQAGIEHLSVGDTTIYWSLLGSSAVRGKLADGTGAIAPEVFGQNSPRWVVVDADAVPYWVAVDGLGVGREVRRLLDSPANTAEPVASGPDVVAVELTAERFYWADRGAQTVQSRAKAAPTEVPRNEFSGLGPVEGFRLEGSTLYVLTAQGGQLQAWRKGPDDETPLLLGKVEAKAAPYYTGGNPFGAAYLLTDAHYVYFADVGTVDTNQVVPVSQGDGVVYRVAR